jgi:hypothetical protein
VALPHLVPLVPPRVFYKVAGGIAVVVASIAAALGTAELGARWIDGYRVFAFRIVRAPSATGVDSPFPGKWNTPEDVSAFVDSLPVASGVKRDWFLHSPALPPDTPVDPDLMKQWNENPDDPIQSVYVWNRAYLHETICRASAPQTVQAKPHRVFVFDPPHGEPYPRFRFLPNAHYPSGLRTNAFGWRGPAIAARKPARTVRIAFVGASTMMAAHGERWSYPELAGVWLNDWAAANAPDVRFEIVNAAREGITSEGIAAIVEQEVVPIAPDLVVYDEGNQFWPGDFVREPVGDMPVRSFTPPHFPLDDYSALSRRLHTLNVIARKEGGEPPKPHLTVDWPADLSETDPDLHDPRLPVKLPQILGDLDRIRHATAAIGSETLLTSFMWLIYDGMIVNPTRDAALLDYLNRTFGQFSYAHVRRYLDFQNRVFAKYARVNGLLFVDYASEYPRDPRLFYDAIHTTTAGIRLQAWIMFQHLATIAQERIRSGRWPQPDRQSGRGMQPPHTERVLISSDEIRATCAANP